MTKHVFIVYTELEEIVELAHKQTLYFEKRFAPGTVEYRNIHDRVILGLCGEKGFELWASREGLRPINKSATWLGKNMPNGTEFYKEDFEISRGMTVEVKSSQLSTLEQGKPARIEISNAERIIHHSDIVVFTSVTITSMPQSPEKRFEKYRHGVDIKIAGWMHATDLRRMKTDDKYYYIPRDIMYTDDELLVYVTKYEKMREERLARYNQSRKDASERERRLSSKKRLLKKQRKDNRKVFYE